jgi:hypothetical protein
MLTKNLISLSKNAIKGDNFDVGVFPYTQGYRTIPQLRLLLIGIDKTRGKFFK